VIRRLGLRTGDRIEGTVGVPPGRGKSAPLDEVRAVNGLDPAHARSRAEFSSLPAAYPDERLKLELPEGTSKRRDFTNRIIDLISPLGKGQRALIVAPARRGKTMVLQAIMEGVADQLSPGGADGAAGGRAAGGGHRDADAGARRGDRLVVRLPGGAPRGGGGDDAGARAAAGGERPRRGDRARLADAAGARLQHHGARHGPLLSGGIDSGALEKPKRFFGSARKVRGGAGSLTIIATALIDTGSRGDEVIFEEFKGTGNSEIVLDRTLADRRIFPAIDIEKSATRREDLVLPEAWLDKVHQLRRALHSMGSEDAINLLMKQMTDTKTNEEMLGRMR
jgi:transcription termination factor Rho